MVGKSINYKIKKNHTASDMFSDSITKMNVKPGRIVFTTQSFVTQVTSSRVIYRGET